MLCGCNAISIHRLLPSYNNWFRKLDSGGIQTVLSNGQQFSMPISMDNCWAIIISDVDIGCDRFGASKSGNSSFLVWSKNNQNNFVKTEFQYVLIGSNN